MLHSLLNITKADNYQFFLFFCFHLAFSTFAPSTTLQKLRIFENNSSISDRRQTQTFRGM